MAKKPHITRSSCYAWFHIQENPGHPATEEEKVTKAIDPIFTKQNERFASFRIHLGLRGQGFGVSLKRVARIMKKNGLYAKSRRRFKRKNKLESKQLRPIIWIGSSARSDLVLVGLGTSLPLIQLMGGAIWLAFWLELHSRRMTDWALRERLESSLTTKALEHASDCRSVNLDELMIHTDQGSQYPDREFQKRLVDKDVT